MLLCLPTTQLLLASSLFELASAISRILESIYIDLYMCIYIYAHIYIYINLQACHSIELGYRRVSPSSS